MVHVSTYKLAFCFLSWLFVLSLTFAVEYVSHTNCVVKTVGHYAVHTTVHCLYHFFCIASYKHLLHSTHMGI